MRLVCRGSNIAWFTAALHPHIVERLVICALPHPTAAMENMGLQQFRRRARTGSTCAHRAVHSDARVLLPVPPLSEGVLPCVASDVACDVALRAARCKQRCFRGPARGLAAVAQAPAR